MSQPVITPATGAAPNASPADASKSTPAQPTDGYVSPKEAAKEKFRRETAELVAKDQKEKERAQRDAQGRFTPSKEEQRQEKADRAHKPEPIEQKAKADEQPKKIWKLKVDGAEVEYDASDEEKVIRDLQKAHAADKRMNEASMTRKQAERFIELLKTNPRAVLEHPSLGVDLKGLAEKIVWDSMQTAAKKAAQSPEDVQREAEKAELERLRAEDAKRKADAKQAEKDELKEKYRKDWSTKFQAELAKAGVPKTDWTLTRMAAYMRQALAKGHTHVQPADVVDFVREDWQAAQREMFASLEGDDLINTLGEEVAEKVRKAQLARFSGGKVPEKAPESTSKEPRKRYATVEDMMRAEPRRK